MITQEGWEGEVDAVISPKHGKFGLCTPLGTWENLDDFSAPDGTSSNFCQTHTQWVDPLWDSVAFGVLLGAIDARLPMAFDTAPGKAQISSLWMYAVAASANRTLHPWLGDTSIPTRGHGSRPFPLTSNAKRATEEGTYALLGYPKGTDGYRSFKTPFVNALFTIGALAPNAPYAATAWVKGPHWERTLARFPHAIIEAGRAIGPTIPTDACGLTEAEIVAGKPAAQGLTRHQHLAFTAMMRQPDATLKRLLPTYARGRKPSTKRQAA